MFLGNLVISNVIGGIIVGLLSDEFSHVFAFSLIWVLISFINLFVFQRGYFVQFKELVKTQETKHNSKATLNPNLVWVIVTGVSAFVISYSIGLLIVLIK